jgi:DNA-binding protein HU-beta
MAASVVIVVYGRELVNKAELIDALAVRLGEKKTASVALDAVLAEIQAVVTKGDKVSITGFGVFEKRVRAARMARNPRTGDAVRVKKTAVPAFRAGAGFKEMVATGRAPKAVAPAKKTTTAAKATVTKAAPARSTAARSTAKTTTAKKTAAKKTSPASATAKKTAAKKTTATKTAPARKTATKTTATAARKTTTKAAAKKTTAAKKAPARKTAAKKTAR